MNKKMLILIPICIGLIMSSCSKADNKARNDKPGSTTQASASKDTGQKTTTAVIDSSLTLEGLKKEAERLGYETIPIDDFQFMGDPSPSDGFNVHYVDSNSDTTIPVLEFNSPDDALKYARNVNAEGYNICIVNGRFITMARAQYGIPMNDDEADFLAKLLKSEVMAPPDEPGSPIISIAEDYAGACKQIDVIKKALNTLVNRAVLTHDKSAAEDKNFSTAFISFNMLTSGNLSFTSYLSENEKDRDTLAIIWTGLGVSDMKVERTDTHTYELTGKRAGMEAPFLIRCAFSPSSGALRLVETNDDRVDDLLEFVPLGGEKFAFQTKSERAVVTYKDGKITAFSYSLLQSETGEYSPDADSIFDRSGLDEAWVMASGEERFSQRVTYDGAVIKIYAESFFTGSRVSADIKVP